jgi:hypothetical protein
MGQEFLSIRSPMLRLSHFQPEISHIDLKLIATSLSLFNTAYFMSVPRTQNTLLALSTDSKIWHALVEHKIH